jgi:hypothetical protein
MVKKLKLFLLILMILDYFQSSLAQTAEADAELAATAAFIGVETSSLLSASIATGTPVLRLIDTLRNDRDAVIVGGAVRYSCRRGNSSRQTRQAQLLHISPVAEDVSTANWPAKQDDSSVPLTEAAVFKLHSRPTATRKAFLQFNGCTTQVRTAAAEVCCTSATLLTSDSPQHFLSCKSLRSRRLNIGIC